MGQRVKTVLLCVVVAALAVSVAGQITASAKVCSKSGTGALCAGSHGSVYQDAPGTGSLSGKLASGKKAVFTAGVADVACSEADLSGETGEGATGKGALTSLTFGGCATGSGSCTVTSSASGASKWPLSAAVGTAPNGTVIIENVTFTLTCGSVTCRYKAPSSKVEVAFTGGETAQLAVSGATIEKEETSSSSCTSTMTWSVTYSITTPDSLFLTTIEGLPALCSKSGAGGACGGGHGSVYGPVLSAKLATGSKATFAFGFQVSECSGSLLGGEISNGSTGEGLVTSLTFTGCTEMGGSACTYFSGASRESPWTLSLKTGASPSGTAEVTSFTYVYSCGGVTCRYKSSAAGSKGEIVVIGGETATITATKVPLEKEATSSFACASTGTFAASWTITKPDSLYLT